MNEEHRPDHGFERAFDELVSRDRKEIGERWRNISEAFRAGGAEGREVPEHLSKVFAALSYAGHYRTLAVLLRGLGRSEAEILDSIKVELIARYKPVDEAWRAVRESGIRLNSEEIVAFLEEIDDSREDSEHIPF